MKAFNAILCGALLLVAVEVRGSIICERCWVSFYCEKIGAFMNIVTVVQKWSKVSGSGELIEHERGPEVVKYFCGSKKRPYTYSTHKARLRVFFTIFSEPNIEEKQLQCIWSRYG